MTDHIPLRGKCSSSKRKSHKTNQTKQQEL